MFVNVRFIILPILISVQRMGYSSKKWQSFYIDDKSEKVWTTSVDVPISTRAILGIFKHKSSDKGVI